VSPPAVPGAPCARPATTRGNRFARPARERGGATLVGMALAGLVLMVGVVAVDVGALAGARAAAQTAADMAALATLTPSAEQAPHRQPEGEGRPEIGGQPTDPGAARAAEIAAANGAELVRCDCSAVQAVVRVTRRVRLVPGGLTVLVTARARAVLGRPPP
jgi:Putative Flp pilus-assembly TadE/G-like